MTKTLTDKWREGKLKEGYYYTLLDTDSKMIEINYCWDDGCFQDYCDNMIDEVLAPVPSYKTVCKLEQLDEDLTVSNECLKMANEKIERLEQQLKEANEAIMSMVGNGSYIADEIGQAYLDKWGVK